METLNHMKSVSHGLVKTMFLNGNFIHHFFFFFSFSEYLEQI